MAPILLWLVMVLCLLISVVKYVMGIMLKLSFPSTQIQKDYSYQPTVSVLMPCFTRARRYTKRSKVSASAIIRTRNSK